MEKNEEIKNNNVRSKTGKSPKTNTESVNPTVEKANMELILKNKTDGDVNKIKKIIEVFTESLSKSLIKYSTESSIKLDSTVYESGKKLSDKINASHIHYVINKNDKWIGILSIDYHGVKSFIQILLNLKPSTTNLQQERNENLITLISKTEKSLLEIVLSTVCNIIKECFLINEDINHQTIKSLETYVEEDNVIVSALSFSNFNGSMVLILNTNITKEMLSYDVYQDAEAMKKGIENVLVEIKFSTNKKKISLNELNNLQNGEVIKFNKKLDILVNEKKIGVGEIGHLGENVAIMCTDFNTN